MALIKIAKLDKSLPFLKALEASFKTFLVTNWVWAIKLNLLISTGGKIIYHKRGFIDKGILYKGQVYPVFSMKQGDRSWSLINSLKSKNITKKDLERLKLTNWSIIP